MVGIEVEGRRCHCHVLGVRRLEHDDAPGHQHAMDLREELAQERWVEMLDDVEAGDGGERRVRPRAQILERIRLRDVEPGVAGDGHDPLADVDAHGAVPMFGQHREPFAAPGPEVEDRAIQVADTGLLEQRQIEGEASTDVLLRTPEVLFERLVGGIHAVVVHLQLTVAEGIGHTLVAGASDRSLADACWAILAPGLSPTPRTGVDGTRRTHSPALPLPRHPAAGDGRHRLQAPLPGVAPGLPVDAAQAAGDLHDPLHRLRPAPQDRRRDRRTTASTCCSAS